MTVCALATRLALLLPAERAVTLARAVDGLTARELYFVVHCLQTRAANQCAAEDAAALAHDRYEADRDIRDQLDVEAHGDR